ncbi:MAG: hypothetical protein P8J79_04035 [Halioglobus sp.]|nr:hypothetical protein [Halioglobus sp.]
MAHQTNGIMEARLSDPRVSQWLMLATYVVGACGYYIGFSTLGSDGAAVAIRPVALLSVGAVGIISMVRHSVFHRSDAVRAGWDLGQRNNFQIEVGFANLAIGLPAVAAVALDWGASVEASLVLAYALYFFQVSVLMLIEWDNVKGRVLPLLLTLMQAGLLGYFALAALSL